MAKLPKIKTIHWDWNKEEEYTEDQSLPIDLQGDETTILDLPPEVCKH